MQYVKKTAASILTSHSKQLTPTPLKVWRHYGDASKQSSPSIAYAEQSRDTI